MPEVNTIGFLGGTFDPIHFGHLRAALEISEALQLDEMRLIPCHNPPHRIPPKAASIHRFNMAKLAVLGSKLKVDDQEMNRFGPSYSIDTLKSLRNLYPHASLCMVVGLDAFVDLTSWHQWENIINLANIVVMYRTGYNLPEKGILIDLVKQHALQPNEKIAEFPNGRISLQNITHLDICASGIREILASKQSPRFLLPEKVLEYIEENRLYTHIEDSLTEQGLNG